jgi:hypothetical protein
MNEKQKPLVSPPPDADGLYKYYVLGDVRPVRVTYNERGTNIFTEAPDPAGGGILKPAVLLVAIMKEEDVEGITKEQFVELCRQATFKKSRSHV